MSQSQHHVVLFLRTRKVRAVACSLGAGCKQTVSDAYFI